MSKCKCKRRRGILAKLRGGTAGLEVVTGTWRGMSRDERVGRKMRKWVEKVRMWSTW